MLDAYAVPLADLNRQTDEIDAELKSLITSGATDDGTPFAVRFAALLDEAKHAYQRRTDGQAQADALNAFMGAADIAETTLHRWADTTDLRARVFGLVVQLIELENAVQRDWVTQSNALTSRMTELYNSGVDTEAADTRNAALRAQAEGEIMPRIMANARLQVRVDQGVVNQRQGVQRYA